MNRSLFGDIMRNTMGEFDPPTTCAAAVLPPGNHTNMAGERYNLLGYEEEGFPYYNSTTHMDGLITSAIPQEPVTGEPDEIYRDYIAAAIGDEKGRSPMNVGGNTGLLFQDPDCSISTGSFTAFAVVCLNSQLVPGCGQFSGESSKGQPQPSQHALA